MAATAVTREHAAKVLEVVNHGLCHGLGTPEPGKMCVEAAVCFALGEPHGDSPSCVGAAVRSYKIKLNDSDWPDNQTRADGMREIAIAQLGSNEIDQREFSNRVLLKVIQQILPIALRAAAKMCPNHSTALEAAAVGCELAVDLVGGRKKAQEARAAASCAASCAACAAACAASYAAYAAYAYADAAASCAAYAVATASADAYAASDAAYAGKTAARVSVLKKAASIGVEVLKEMGCRGTQWLDLIP